MKFGVAIFATDRTITPEELAREVEANGFESLFFPEHTHIPVDHTPHPSGKPLPDKYKRTHDPIVAMATAAAATTSLRIGTGICLVAQHDPIVLAKQIASLDVLSQGRVLFGAGYGWNKEELEQHGVRFEDRIDVVGERLLAMRRLWMQEEASFEGKHVHLRPTWLWPKPMQRPHPPILIGGPARGKILEHIVEFADGWLPDASGLEDGLPKLRDKAAEIGRDMNSIAITAYGASPDGKALDRYRELGVERAVFWLASASRDAVLAELEGVAQMVRN